MYVLSIFKRFIRIVWGCQNVRLTTWLPKSVKRVRCVALTCEFSLIKCSVKINWRSRVALGRMSFLTSLTNFAFGWRRFYAPFLSLPSCSSLCSHCIWMLTSCILTYMLRWVLTTFSHSLWLSKNAASHSPKQSRVATWGLSFARTSSLTSHCKTCCVQRNVRRVLWHSWSTVEGSVRSKCWRWILFGWLSYGNVACYAGSKIWIMQGRLVIYLSICFICWFFHRSASLGAYSQWVLCLMGQNDGIDVSGRISRRTQCLRDAWLVCRLAYFLTCAVDLLPEMVC